jgi:uncharacterized protein
MTGTHGKFYWNELMTRDVERAKKFYTDTLGWTFESMPMPTDKGKSYWIAKANGEPAGGLFDLTGPEFNSVPESWMSYIAVDNVDARRIAILMEPGGAGVGWITPAQQ